MCPPSEGVPRPHTSADDITSGTEGYVFRFVEVGEPSQGQGEAARTIIRSHVMRDFHNRRDRIKQPGVAPWLLSTPLMKDGVKQQMQRFKVGPEGLKEVKRGRKKERKGLIPIVSKITEAQAQAGNGSKSHGLIDPSINPISERQQHQTDDSSSGHKESSLHDPGYLFTGNNLSLVRSPSSPPNPRPYDVPGAGLLDPFDTLPQIKSSRTQLLLYHANQGILASRLMGKLRTEWLALATQDAALFYVALSHYAGNYSLANNQSDPMEALRFRMESMKLINSRLEDIDNALTDGTLGTVASLSSYEATNGSLEAIKTHMKGLRKLLELRGGLGDPNINPYTRRLVLWADLNCANALGTNSTIPILNISDIDHSDESHQSYIHTCRDPKRNSASGDWDLETLTSKFSENLTTLKYLATMNENDNGCSSGGKAQQIKDSDTLYFTERSLQQLSNCWGPRKFATSGCIAAIIFLDNCLRGIQLNSRLMDRLVARLYHSMQLVFEDMSQYSGKEKANNAIFWVLFVGGVASGVRHEREWFLAQLINFKDLLGVQSWEGAEAILKEFLWPKIWCRLGSFLWNEVEDTQKIEVPAGSRTSHRGVGAHIDG